MNRTLPTIASALILVFSFMCVSGCTPSLLNNGAAAAAAATSAKAETSAALAAPTVTVANQSGTWGSVFSFSPVVTGAITKCEISPALPTALALSETTCAITGTPAASLTNSFTLTLTHSGGTLVSDAFTINIPAPVVTASISGMSIIASVSNFGGVANFSVTPSSGLTVSKTSDLTASITGDAVSSTLIITASDSSGNVLASSTIDVGGGGAGPQITVADQTGTWGVPFSYVPTTSGVTSCSLSSNWPNLTSLPSGLSLDPVTCAITGTPRASLTSSSYAGNSFALSGSGSGGTAVSNSFTITIPAPIVNLSAKATSANVGVAIAPFISVSLSNFKDGMSGPFPSFSVSPPLPDGIGITPTGYTALISGGSTVPISQVFYVIAKDELGNFLGSNEFRLTVTNTLGFSLITKDYSTTAGYGGPTVTILGVCNTDNLINITTTRPQDGSNKFLGGNDATANCVGGTWSYQATLTHGSTTVDFTATNAAVSATDSITLTYCASLDPIVSAAYPAAAGTSSDPYLISTKEQLARIADDATANLTTGKVYKLDADLDLACVNWTPIGTVAHPFRGTFDGNGKTISNLIVTSAVNESGLFGVASSATFRDLILKRIGVYGQIAGGLVGNIPDPNFPGSTYSPIFNVHVGGTVNGGQCGLLAGRYYGTINAASSWGQVYSNNGGGGGLIGMAVGTAFNGGMDSDLGAHLSSSASVTGGGGLIGSGTGDLAHASASGRVTAVGVEDPVGGLMGAYLAGSLTDAHATGAISASGSVTLGGLLGRAGGSWANISISGVYATGSVTGGRADAGGLIGWANSSGGGAVSVSDCYAHGSVAVDSSLVGGTANQAGGLIGKSDGGVTVTRCYASGPTTDAGGSATGDLIGTATNSTVTDSHALSFATRLFSTASSGVIQSGCNLETPGALILKITYFGWDFDSLNPLWEIDNGISAPTLR